MRTLALLAALALLAFQAQANLSPETAGEAPDQEQPGDEDQEVSISLGGAEGSALKEAGAARLLKCHCRKRACLFLLERLHGICTKGKKNYLFCCR